ncbi:MAG: U32 family peptidase, partial [Clostridiales bacterium]|nr:U32 family peptidase [Clostridiales bacterium]
MEILAPAGDEQSAYTALLAGADAIYLGLTQFSARQSAENFDVSALERTARLAHLLGAKVYVCLNTLVKDGETDDFFAHALAAWNAGADAILIQDMFLGQRLKELYPEIVLHLSTQAGCCNIYGASLAKECGFSRAVLARETPLSEIAKISQVIETEVFVQGALCTAFSGQCYLSSFAGNNSGNRGRCKQPCRKKYTVDRAGYTESAYALSTSDLCVGERVKELLAAGVSSLKIEGRL